MGRVTKAESQTTRRIAIIMTKSIGIEPLAVVCEWDAAEATAVALGSTVWIINHNWVNQNPHRVHCPLCRRRTTVAMLGLVNPDSVVPGQAEYECGYDGCKGLRWKE